VALYDFAPEQPDELSLRKGDVVVVVSQDKSRWGEGWWMGRRGNEEGLFPSDYVQLL
jgi:hypothetical protein